MKTTKKVRLSFWEAHPEFSDDYRKTYRQNQYKTDIRIAFCDFVENLRENGVISENLAQRVTL